MSARPGFWMKETSGVLAPAVEKYLQGDDLDAAELAAMRAYLRQWVNAPGFIGPDVRRLRREIDQVTTNETLRSWLERALDAGIDPL